MENSQKNRCLALYKPFIAAVIALMFLIFIYDIWGFTATIIIFGIILGASFINYLVSLATSDPPVSWVQSRHPEPTSGVTMSEEPVTTASLPGSPISYRNSSSSGYSVDVDQENPPSYLEVIDSTSLEDTPSGPRVNAPPPMSLLPLSCVFLAYQDPQRSFYDVEEPPTYEEAVRKASAVD